MQKNLLKTKVSYTFITIALCKLTTFTLVTLFRFLRDCEFDFDKAHERLLETIIWRIDIGISDLTWESSIEFFENDQGAFSFYHKTDKANRPLIFVRLRLFPSEFRDPAQRLSDHIKRYACLLMELGRKLTWEMTCDRIKQNEPCALVSQMTVVVNIQKAPIIPIVSSSVIISS
jgi:hypothetical protein